MVRLLAHTRSGERTSQTNFSRFIGSRNPRPSVVAPTRTSLHLSWTKTEKSFGIPRCLEQKVLALLAEARDQHANPKPKNLLQGERNPFNVVHDELPYQCVGDGQPRIFALLRRGYGVRSPLQMGPNDEAHRCHSRLSFPARPRQGPCLLGLKLLGPERKYTPLNQNHQFGEEHR